MVRRVCKENHSASTYGLDVAERYVHWQERVHITKKGLVEKICAEGFSVKESNEIVAVFFVFTPQSPDRSLPPCYPLPSANYHRPYEHTAGSY